MIPYSSGLWNDGGSLGLFNTSGPHLSMFWGDKMARQPPNHSSLWWQGAGNDNCLNMPQLAPTQSILIHSLIHSHTCYAAEVKSTCPSTEPAEAPLSNLKSSRPRALLHSLAIVPALFTHYSSQKQSQSKSSSSSPLDEPESIYLGFIHQQLSSA